MFTSDFLEKEESIGDKPAERMTLEHNMPAEYLYIPRTQAKQTSELERKFKAYETIPLITNYRILFEPADDEFVHLMKKGFKKIGKGIKKGWKAVKKGVKKIAKGVVSWAKSAAKWVKNAAKKLGEWAKKVGATFAKWAKAIGNAIKKAWNSIMNFFKNFFGKKRIARGPRGVPRRRASSGLIQDAQ